MLRLEHTLAAAPLLACSLPAMAATDLDARIQAQLAGDRSGACVAVAVIERGQVSRSLQCARPADVSRIEGRTAFEIGSLSKPMTATVLARLIAAGHGSLDDRLADWLPAGTHVPDWQGEPIRLRHLVTHTSGLPRLPPGMEEVDAQNPYARLDADAVLAALQRTELDAAPGSRFAYSNYALMLLSLGLVQRTGQDLADLFERELFAPLGMVDAHLGQAPEGLRLAQPHTGTGQPTLAWEMAADLAGFGGVRATLDDMVAWAQAVIGPPAALAPALELAGRPLSQQPPMAMNWLLARLDGRTVLTHEGGTGGSSSYIAVDRERQRAVVVLSDTSWTTAGGISPFGQHLLDARLPAYQPHRPGPAPSALLERLAGEYAFAGIRVRLQPRDGQLQMLTEGEPALLLEHDSAGDFHPHGIDARIEVADDDGGRPVLVWHQDGGSQPLLPVSSDEQPAAVSAAALDDYAGQYPLQPGFVLSVDADNGRLRARATGQGAFHLQAEGPDRFTAPAHGLHLQFHRGEDGRVQALTLHQAGNRIRAARQ